MIPYTRVYVISDTHVVKPSRMNTVHLRSVPHKAKSFVVVSPHKDIIRYLKHNRDDYYITGIRKDILTEYCKNNKLNVLCVSNIYCDILSRKAHFDYEEFCIDIPERIAV